jgi:hypothetical protein
MHLSPDFEEIRNYVKFSMSGRIEPLKLKNPLFVDYSFKYQARVFVTLIVCYATATLRNDP